MKKLFAIVIAGSMLSGLYGLSIGLGGAYDGITETGYFSVRADVMCKAMPFLGFRLGLVQVDFPSGTTPMYFGTGISTDVMLFIPMAGMISPYIPMGVSYSDAYDVSTLHLKGGLGAEFGFGGFNGYLEGGINFWNIDISGVSGSTNPIYVQGGVRFPVPL